MFFRKSKHFTNSFRGGFPAQPPGAEIWEAQGGPRRGGHGPSAEEERQHRAEATATAMRRRRRPWRMAPPDEEAIRT